MGSFDSLRSLRMTEWAQDDSVPGLRMTEDHPLFILRLPVIPLLFLP